MAKAIFIYDTYPVVFELEKRLRRLPEVYLSNDPKATTKLFCEVWFSEILIDVGVLTELPRTATLPNAVRSELFSFGQDFARAALTQIKIPDVFKVHTAALAVYRKDLWLVYHF